MTKVMVICGEQDIREMLDLCLRKDGFETTALENESEFLEKIDSFQPDLIALDVITLGIVTKKNLDVLKKSKSKIILLTAVRYSKIEKQILREKANVVDYVTKPIDIDDFKDKIVKNLDK